MARPRPAAALAAALLGGALLAGCGGHSGTGRPASASAAASTTTAPSPAVANLDTSASLTLALPSAPGNWNPLSASGASAAGTLIAAGVLPAAFEVQPNDTWQLNSEFVASTAETRQSPQTVVYHLNPKAVWSDGVPITASDFIYTWQAQSGKAGYTDVGGHPFTPASTLGYSQIASVAAAANNPDTVTVVFSSPFAGWQSLFSPILPAHVAQSVGFDSGFTDPVADDVSGGPFLVQSEVPGRSVTLVRNTRYWGPPAALSSLTIDFASSQEVAGSLLRGQLGAALLGVGQLAPSGGILAQLRSTTGLKVDEGPGPEWEDLEFSPDSPLLSDIALRQAIMLSVDRSALITATLGSPAGVVPIGNRFFLPQAAGYADNTQGRYLHANLSEARQILASAGYSDSGGVLRKGVTPVTLTLVDGVDDTLHQSEEAALASDLSALGISVQASTSADLAQVLSQGSFDLAIVDQPGSVNPEAEALPTLLGQQAAAAGSPVSAGAPAQAAELASAENLEREAAAAATVEAQDALYNKLDRLLWSDAASLPLFQIPTVLAYQSGYANLANVPAPGGLGYHIAQWGLSNSS